jgi:5'-methylthioadenosine phosphorylase
MAMAEIAVIGGSGFYSLPLEDERRLVLQTPYGPASDAVTLGRLGGRPAAFLPRHGVEHHLPPHRVPYRANLYALRELGVTQVIGCCAVGALGAEFAPGSFALASQLVDWTHGMRTDTFYDGPLVTHIDAAEPYCPLMRAAALQAAASLELPLADGATIVATSGPRFSTRAESQFFAGQGWQLENMTQYPEAVLARELNLSYLNISLVTNSYAQLPGAAPPEAANGTNGIAAGVMELLATMVPRLRELLLALAPLLPAEAERPAFIRHATQRGRWG